MSVWNWKVSNKAGQKVNYQKELDKLILELKKEEKKLQWKPYSGFCGAFYRRFCCP